MNETQIRAALDYHSHPRPGKIEIVPTKPVETRADLAMAYTPGVGEASMEIARNPDQAARLTGRSNLVAVISDGTAVLGLGNIGPLASKPVMEGKSVLFKLLGGVNAFDIEVDTRDPDHFVDVVAALEPTFGGINLEDIKAPECFEIEERLKARMKIPVMHDDQHGTAVVVAAAPAQRPAPDRPRHREYPPGLHRRRRLGHRLPQPAGRDGAGAQEHLHDG